MVLSSCQEVSRPPAGEGLLYALEDLEDTWCGSKGGRDSWGIIRVAVPPMFRTITVLDLPLVGRIRS